MRPVGVSGEMDFIPLKIRGWCEMIQFKPYSFASVTVFSFTSSVRSTPVQIFVASPYTANVHRSNMSAKVVISVGETIIFVQKLADDRNKICI